VKVFASKGNPAFVLVQGIKQKKKYGNDESESSNKTQNKIKPQAVL
jgi:hypothetical protein